MEYYYPGLLGSPTLVDWFFGREGKERPDALAVQYTCVPS